MTKDNRSREKQFLIENKIITLYKGEAPSSPILYLNTAGDRGEGVYSELTKRGIRDLSLVTITGLDWNKDLVPWTIPPIFRGGEGYTGGADQYLNLLTTKIIPEVEATISEEISWRGIAGYSLAGLFALYSMYNTDLFSRIGSISGSLWFPNFEHYAKVHPIEKKPERLYLSLGKKEAKVRNPYLRKVESITEDLSQFYRQDGIDVKFELNPGNHFVDAVERTVKGIKWLVKDQL